MRRGLRIGNGINLGGIDLVLRRGGSAADTTPPTVVITCTQTSPTGVSPLNFTFTFSETVTGFAVGDITVGNGTAGNFAGSGAVYTADVTPTANGAVTVDVAQNVCVDGAGNQNTAATQFSINYSALLNGLVAYWKLEEASGNRVDATGRGNALAPAGTSLPGNTTGIVGNGVSLTAANAQKLKATINADLQVSSTGDWGFSGWIRTTNVTDGAPLVSVWNSEGGNQKSYMIWLYQAKLQVWISSNGADNPITWLAADVSINTTYHIAVWRDSVGGKIYASLNGAAAVSTDYAGAVFQGTSTFRIGDAADFFTTDGWIDEVGKWTRKLTAADVAALYNGGSGITHPFDVTAPLLIFDGDSLTLGYPAASGNTYPELVVKYYGSKFYWDNFGANSLKITDMTSDGVAQIDALYSVTHRKNIVVEWGGLNDIWNTADTAATVHGNIQTYCAARRSAGFKVVALTITPTTAVGTPGDYETRRVALNTLIRANWGTYADALVDVAADSRLSDSTNATYFYEDNLHLTEAGYAVVAGLVETAITGLL